MWLIGEDGSPDVRLRDQIPVDSLNEAEHLFDQELFNRLAEAGRSVRQTVTELRYFE